LLLIFNKSIFCPHTSLIAAYIIKKNSTGSTFTQGGQKCFVPKNLQVKYWLYLSE